jgi:hypothetical protein
MGKKKDIYRLLVSITAGKRLLGKPGSKVMGDVKMSLKEMGQKGVRYIIWFGMGTRGGLL